MAKEGETLFFCLPTCLFFSSTCQLVIRQLVTRQLVNNIQCGLNYAKKYIKFCWL